MNQNIEEALRQLTSSIFEIINHDLTNSFISSFGGSNSNDLIKVKLQKTIILVNQSIYNNQFQQSLDLLDQISGLLLSEISLNKLNENEAKPLLNQITDLKSILKKEM